MYTPVMKRPQIYIEAEMDDALAVRALRERTSKAALIRQFVAEKLATGGPKVDPLDGLVGRYDEESGDVDRVVYDG
ncbi:MAG: hypothetical protein HW416_2687 [Chloroflexi bacterium]|nr:hypothetical protein [Chloroflexota bacterium]